MRDRTDTAYPERIVPDETPPGIVSLHLKRYDFALPWCAGKDVLDGACGVGYGAAHLAPQARRVLGVDASAEAVEYARRRYGRPNVEFVCMDLLELELPDSTFDVVCSFETVEHLADPERFLSQVVRVLRPAGILVVSTPRADRTTHSPENPFHTVEFSTADFEQLLGRHFGAIELYGQRRAQTARHRLLQRLDVLGLRKRLSFARQASRLLGTPPTSDLTLDDVVISPEHVEGASELIAVCMGPRAL